MQGPEVKLMILNYVKNISHLNQRLQFLGFEARRMANNHLYPLNTRSISYALPHISFIKKAPDPLMIIHDTSVSQECT